LQQYSDNFTVLQYAQQNSLHAGANVKPCIVWRLSANADLTLFFLIYHYEKQLPTVLRFANLMPYYVKCFEKDFV
jgi:hypothetical protein